MENKKNNFKRIAENRTNKIINMITLLGNFTNSSFYEYTDEEIESLFSSIQNELDKQHEIFKKNGEKKRKFEL
jgi:cytoskeletal protein RodZ